VTGILAVQFCFIEISDSSFKGNQAGVDAREFSAPRIHHNRFESNQAAVTLVRKTHARVEKNVFFHNRNCVVVNYSSYPLITGNNFDRNDMSVRLEKFQSGDWEERAGSPKITAEEAAKRGMMNRPAAIGQVVSGDQKMVFPKRVNAKGNFWGPDADRDPSKGTLGKIWDGKKFGPVRYEGFGEGEYAIDVVDFSEESPSPFPDAGPREKPGSVPSGKTG
jgi:parallel beta-helix repeat protein